jgi:PAS domain S-box-containing protein
MELEIDPAAKIQRLERCMNDLASLLALPAMWAGGDPFRVARILLDALVEMLQLDFAYISWNGPPSATPVEMVRVGGGFSQSAKEIGDLFREFREDDLGRWPSQVLFSAPKQTVSILPLALGPQVEFGVVVAGSGRAGFPLRTESVLMGVAANLAAIGLRETRLLDEQKRLAKDLDDRVAQRTSELAAINENLIGEIVDRRRAEEALRANERDLNHIINTIPVLAWCNLPDGSNEFLNQPWHDYTGLPPEEAHGWGWQVAIHPDDLPGLLDKWSELLASGDPGELEARLRRADGVYQWFLFRVNPLRDEAGNIVKWYGTNTDIDGRKQAEEALRRSEAFLAEGQYLARMGNLYWNVGTGEIIWSDPLYSIFGFEPGTPVTLEQIAGRVHPDDVQQMEDMIGRARRGEADFEYYHRIVMPDRSVKHLHLIGHRIHDRPEETEYVGAVLDITERRVSEEALEQARAELAHVSRVTSLGALTASIAHEINQPLSGIVTNAGTCLRMLAADPPNVEGARETARRTIRDGNRAADVIARLRALFSNRPATIEPVDLNDVVTEVIALARRDLQRNQVIVSAELTKSLPLVGGDRVQLQQVVMNLLRNAVDAMDGLDDRLRRLVVLTEPDGGDHARLTVRDVGVGFRPEQAKRLFEAFYTTKQDGMGIGLSVSRSIIERHGGRLWAASNDGPGASFSFSIPVYSVDEAAVPRSITTSASATGDPRIAREAS